MHIFEIYPDIRLNYQVMQTNLVHMINGKLVEEKDATIPVKDLGLLRGYAVFDFLVTYNQRPFMLDDHINRLFNSAISINLFNPWAKAQVRKLVLQTIRANDQNFEKTIKIILTGGVSQNGFTPENKTQLIILIDRYERTEINIYTRGVNIITHKYRRQIPKCKTNNYTEAIKILKNSQAFEVLYYSESQVFECSRSNIFALIKGELLTPKDNILQGITRKVVLEALKLPLPILKANFTLSELLDADEVFITKSNDEIIPVIKIDNKVIGDGEVGEITKSVMKVFAEFTGSKEWQE
jgi:branched-chain amino acid aminotransferase